MKEPECSTYSNGDNKLPYTPLWMRGKISNKLSDHSSFTLLIEADQMPCKKQQPDVYLKTSTHILRAQSKCQLLLEFSNCLSLGSHDWSTAVENSSEVWSRTATSRWQWILPERQTQAKGPHLLTASRSNSWVCSFLSVCLRTLNPYWEW